jgi:hypothetical protein
LSDVALPLSKTLNMRISYPAIKTQVSTWLHMLDAMQEANLGLKHRLAQQVREAGTDRKKLETFENFLNNFLNKDTHIALLRRDLNYLERLSGKVVIDSELSGRFQKLQSDIERMGAEFQRLKTEFELNTCLS